MPNSERIDARSRSRVAEVGESGPLRTQHALNFDFSRIRIDDPGARNRAIRSVGAAAPPIVDRVLASPGEALAEPERQKFQTGLGRPLAHVRVHHDTLATESADSVGAAAYTVGSHIVLGHGHAPGSPAYERTLAHELVHVAQQSGRRAGATIPIGALGSRHEREADHAADQLVRGARVTPQTTVPLELSRQPRLTIVDVDSGLDEKQLAVVVVEAKKAIGSSHEAQHRQEGQGWSRHLLSTRPEGHREAGQAGRRSRLRHRRSQGAGNSFLATSNGEDRSRHRRSTAAAGPQAGRACEAAGRRPEGNGRSEDRRSSPDGASTIRRPAFPS